MEEFDSEGFSMSEEDEDYVPSGGEYTEDDVNELMKEDEVDGEEAFQPGREDKEEEDANSESESSSRQKKGIGSEEARKKEKDELWAKFLNDMGPKSKVPPSTQVKKVEETEETSSTKLLVKAEELEKPKETENVKITKVFDFAGEEVRVTKEADATSKEAKSFFKQHEKEKPQAKVSSALPSLPARSGSLLGKSSAKKQKMSTLEKSKLDWESIGEDLAIGNRGKEGYTKWKAFLDDRQFETEWDLRLSKMKP
uniref:Craniofacial development protein 1 n=1 Tax=Cebus imitator TaxID=2715852 RepID=A0A2K5QQ13_CEBIM